MNRAMMPSSLKRDNISKQRLLYESQLAMQFGVFEVSPIFEVLKGTSKQTFELNLEMLARVTYILEWLPNSVDLP